MKPTILILIFTAVAMSLACGPSAASTLAPSLSETPIPTPTATLNPAPPTTTATPSPSREWEVERIDVDGTTVDLHVRVFSGVEIQVTLGGESPQMVSETAPTFVYHFAGVTPGAHILEVSDLAGNTLVQEVSVPQIPSAGLPNWLGQIIRNLESQPPANPPFTITRYEYQSQVVYYQTATCCEIFSNVYNEEGEIIGHPDGGITGQGDGRLPDFLQERDREFLIWRDAREQADKITSAALAPIESADLQIAESFPLQYFVRVLSGLPDGCHSFGGYTLNRDSFRVIIQVFNHRPSDSSLSCIQVYGTIETNIHLGSDFDPEQTYTIDVNGKTISFTGDTIIERARTPVPTPPERGSPGQAPTRETDGTMFLPSPPLLPEDPMPEHFRIYLDAWPVERKLSIEPGVVVIFTYPHPAVLWDQTASLYHTASMSRVDLNSNGKVAITLYGNEEGRQTLEKILSNDSLMKQIRGLIPWENQ